MVDCNWEQPIWATSVALLQVVHNRPHVQWLYSFTTGWLLSIKDFAFTRSPNFLVTTFPRYDRHLFNKVPVNVMLNHKSLPFMALVDTNSCFESMEASTNSYLISNYQPQVIHCLRLHTTHPLKNDHFTNHNY